MVFGTDTNVHEELKLSSHFAFGFTSRLDSHWLNFARLNCRRTPQRYEPENLGPADDTRSHKTCFGRGRNADHNRTLLWEVDDLNQEQSVRRNDMNGRFKAMRSKFPIEPSRLHEMRSLQENASFGPGLVARLP